MLYIKPCYNDLCYKEVVLYFTKVETFHKIFSVAVLAVTLKLYQRYDLDDLYHSLWSCMMFEMVLYKIKMHAIG